MSRLIEAMLAMLSKRMTWMLLVLATLVTGSDVVAQRPRPDTGQAAGTRTTFEVVSIRRSDLSKLPAGLEGEDPCSQALLRRTGNRLVGNTTTLYALIALAYNPWKLQCARARTSNLIVGGPDWIRTERYAIEAVWPDDAGASTDERLFAGDAPEVQRMLVAMLTERFKVRVRREPRDTPVFLLTPDDTPAATRTRLARARTAGAGIPERLATQRGIFSSSLRDRDGTAYWSIAFVKQTMSGTAQRLVGPAQRLVLDRTGLDGEFDFVLEYDDSGIARPTVFTALREQIGLKLQPGRAPVEVLVIEAAERPSEN